MYSFWGDTLYNLKQLYINCPRGDTVNFYLNVEQVRGLQWCVHINNAAVNISDFGFLCISGLFLRIWGFQTCPGPHGRLWNLAEQVHHLWRFPCVHTSGSTRELTWESPGLGGAAAPALLLKTGPVMLPTPLPGLTTQIYTPDWREGSPPHHTNSWLAEPEAYGNAPGFQASYFTFRVLPHLQATCTVSIVIF